MDRDRLGRNPPAYGPVVVHEEAVEDAVAGRLLDPDVHQAAQLGGIDRQVAGLLRDEDVTAQHGRVVDHVADALAAEFDVGRGLDFLTPESVEGRKAGVLESGDVGPLVQLERRGDGFADDSAGLAEGQAQEDILVRDTLGGILRAGGLLLGSLAAGRGRCGRIGDDFDARALRRDLLAAHGRIGQRQLEGSGPARRQHVGVRGLGIAAALAVHDAHGGGRAARRPPDQLEVIAGTPLEIGRGAVALDDEAEAELLADRHEVGGLHPDGCLGEGGEAAEKQQQDGHPSSVHTTNSSLFVWTSTGRPSPG